MKLKKIKNSVVAYDLSTTELYNLLKVQIKTKIEFVKNETVIGFIYLLDRTVKNGIQHINVSKIEEAKNPEVISYNELLEEINKLINLGVPQVVFNASDFNKKRPLIEIIGDIKEQIINGCVYVDYVDGMFSIINKPLGKKPNKLYFWEDTGSLFVFGKTGPVLQYETDFDSIEEIICN